MNRLLKPPTQIIDRLLADDGAIPNHPTLPLLVYQSVLSVPKQQPAREIESLLAANGWGNSWRNGIYPFHHYHSTAHEVLVIYRGWATVQLGGEKGITLQVKSGDVIILPAGVGHKNLGDSGDLGVVGAYPPGQHWDMNYGQPGERPRADQNMARVPLPHTDPVFGAEGPLLRHWPVLDDLEGKS